MKQIKQAVILAGGRGTRMQPLTFSTPKPMIRIHGKPFLEYIIRLLKNNGIERVLILTGYLHKQIEEYFKDGEKFGLSISYSYSPVEDNTGARVRKAKKLIDEVFLLVYGDNYWPLNLDELSSFYKKKNRQGLVTVYLNPDSYTKNNIFVNPQRFVEIYDKKKENLNGVDIGFFIFKKSILNLLPQENCSFEKIILQELIKKKQLVGYLTSHKYYGLSNLERLPAIKDFFTYKKVVFLDRDGVINKKPAKAEYVKDWKEFSYLPRVKDALKLLVNKKYTLFIVSNQAGIARGNLTRMQADSINNKMKKDLFKIGVTIEEIYMCPHGWNEGCFCRKPNPGLFFQAASEHHINLFDTYCIGDDARDIIAGRLAGCKTIFLGDARKNEFASNEKPDVICKDLYEAVKYL